ncbi:hypothetical protein T4A_275, partial [Trichinella pseudospiralis]
LFSRPHPYGALIRFPRGGGGMLFLLFVKHYLKLMNLLIAFLSNSMVYRSGKEHNNCYCKVLLQIESRKNLCLLSVLNSSHSRTCLPENLRACGVRCECNGVLYAMTDEEYY